jgi:hypothetical protein
MIATSGRRRALGLQPVGEFLDRRRSSFSRDAGAREVTLTDIALYDWYKDLHAAMDICGAR